MKCITLSLFLSVLSSAAAFCFLVYFARSNIPSGLLVLTASIFSKTFVDYSTSGLENPLSFLLLSLLFYAWIQYNAKGHSSKRYLGLVFLGCFLALNRLDMMLFVLPVLFFAILKDFSVRKITCTFIGFLPLIAWEILSLIYYGFLFPNTAYAKLNTGISPYDLIDLGINYILITLKVDPVTIVIIAATLGLAAFKRKQSKAVLPFLVGLVLYLLYTVKIGGDFMVGRFLSVPFFVSLLCLVKINDKQKVFPLILVALLVVLLPFYQNKPFLTGPDYSTESDVYGIEDEKGKYFAYTGLLPRVFRKDVPLHPWASLGDQLREENVSAADYAAMGLLGYHAGPYVHIIDVFALCDPLLARLPATREPKLKAGHYARTIPEGYRDVIMGAGTIHDPDLNTFCKKLFLVTRGDIWDPKRLVEIINFALGKNQKYLEHYLRTNKDSWYPWTQKSIE